MGANTVFFRKKSGRDVESKKTPHDNPASPISALNISTIKKQFNNKKNVPACKPDSVRTEVRFRHLSAPDLTAGM